MYRFDVNGGKVRRTSVVKSSLGYMAGGADWDEVSSGFELTDRCLS